MTTGSLLRNGIAARLAASLLMGAGLLALTACDQRAEPRPTYEAAPPPPPAPLAGAPESAPTAAPSMDVEPPPPEPSPSLAPPQGPPPPPFHDEGLVAMAPIPNPPSDRVVARPRRHAYRPAPPAAGYPAHHRIHHRLRVGPAAPAPVPPRVARPPATAIRPAPASHVPAKTVPHPATPRAAAPHGVVPAPSKVAVVAPPVRHEHRASRAELRHAAKTERHGTTTSNTTAGNTTGAAVDARTDALRAALSTALARGAVLTVPKMAADQAADMTLAVPADFYDTLKTEAGKQAMGDAAASANLNAALTGEGYAIIPGGAQAQPVRAGQPTTFHWTVTAPAGAKGPLRADVSANLLGGGSQILPLGAVDQGTAGGAAPRWWGAGLLALVVALGLGWLIRSRSADARIAAARRRAKRPDGTVSIQRPLDMGPRDGPLR